MAETQAPDAGSIEAVLANESEAETKVDIDSPKDSDSIEEKAKAKLNMMNVPTERKQAEDLAKMVSQIHSAEEQKSVDITQSTVHPEHQTFGVLGIPMAAAVHDYDLDPAAKAQATVKTKTEADDKAIKAHNESLARIVKNIENGNDE